MSFPKSLNINRPAFPINSMVPLRVVLQDILQLFKLEVLHFNFTVLGLGKYQDHIKNKFLINHPLLKKKKDTMQEQYNSDPTEVQPNLALRTYQLGHYSSRPQLILIRYNA